MTIETTPSHDYPFGLRSTKLGENGGPAEMWFAERDERAAFVRLFQLGTDAFDVADYVARDGGTVRLGRALTLAPVELNAGRPTRREAIDAEKEAARERRNRTEPYANGPDSRFI